MNKAEKILAEKSNNKSLVDPSFESTCVSVNTALNSMKEIAEQAFKAGEISGREDVLIAQRIIEDFQCKAVGFNEWFKK